MSRILFSLAFILALTVQGRADTPLGNTVFWLEFVKAESDPIVVQMIRKASATADLDEKMFEFLADEKISLGAKLSLINASFSLWKRGDPNVSSNPRRFHKFLQIKYDRKFNVERPEIPNQTLVWHMIFGQPKFNYPDFLNAGELMSLGYLYALDNTFAPADSLGLLYGAVKEAPQSVAARIAFALAIGNMAMATHDHSDEFGNMGFRLVQALPNEDLARYEKGRHEVTLDTQFAYVYSLFVLLLDQKARLNSDFPEGAFQAIMEYIKLYEPNYNEWHSRRQSSSKLLGLSCNVIFPTNEWTKL